MNNSFIYVDITPLELFRGGASFDIRTKETTPNKRPDIQTEYRSGTLYVLKSTGGLSLFDNIYPGYKAKIWCKIPAGSTIPSDLMLERDHQLHGYDIWHYVLSPRQDMPLQEYVAALERFAQMAHIMEIRSV